MLMGLETSGTESEGLPFCAAACGEHGLGYQYSVKYCNLLYFYASNLRTLLQSDMSPFFFLNYCSHTICISFSFSD